MIIQTNTRTLNFIHFFSFNFLHKIALKIILFEKQRIDEFKSIKKRISFNI